MAKIAGKLFALQTVVDIALSNAAKARFFLAFERDAERRTWASGRAADILAENLDFFASRSLENLENDQVIACALIQDFTKSQGWWLSAYFSWDRKALHAHGKWPRLGMSLNPSRMAVRPLEVSSRNFKDHRSLVKQRHSNKATLCQTMFSTCKQNTWSHGNRNKNFFFK